MYRNLRKLYFNKKCFDLHEETYNECKNSKHLPKMLKLYSKLYKLQYWNYITKTLDLNNEDILHYCNYNNIKFIMYDCGGFMIFIITNKNATRLLRKKI